MSSSNKPADPKPGNIDPRFLRCRFQRRLKWNEEETGRVIVYRPRFGESPAARWLTGRLRLSDYRIRLDEIGSAVWKDCDGITKAREIVAHMRLRFGKRIEPAEERLYRFVGQMQRARMIEVIPS